MVCITIHLVLLCRYFLNTSARNTMVYYGGEEGNSTVVVVRPSLSRRQSTNSRSGGKLHRGSRITNPGNTDYSSPACCKRQFTKESRLHSNDVKAPGGAAAQHCTIGAVVNRPHGPRKHRTRCRRRRG